MVKKFLYLNGLAALNVVVYHSTGWGFTAMFWWTDRYRAVQVPDFSALGGFTYWVFRSIEQLVVFSLPAFLFVSGFFIAFAAGRSKSNLPWQIVYSRIRKLVIPFLLWSVLILAAQWVEGQRLEPVDLILTVITGRTQPPYYFVPVLVQLFILAPWIVRSANNHPKTLLSVAAFLTLLTGMLRYIQLLNLDFPAPDALMLLARSWFFPGYSLWFVGGVLAGFHINRLKDWLHQMRWPMLSVAVVLFFVGLFEWEWILQNSGQEWVGTRETFIDQLYSIALILSYLGFENFIPPLSGQLADWGGKSFGIYLVHSPILQYAARGIYHILPQLLQYHLFFVLLLIAFGLGGSLLLMAVVNRSPVRKYYSLIFG